MFSGLVRVEEEEEEEEEEQTPVGNEEGRGSQCSHVSMLNVNLVELVVDCCRSWPGLRSGQESWRGWCD